MIVLHLTKLVLLN